MSDNLAVTMFTPSSYQAEFFKQLWDPRGPRNLVMRARAGAGKSTAAVEGCRGLPGSGRTFPSGDPVPSVLVACFNVEIRKELASMLEGMPHVEVKGAHQCGLRTISRTLGKEIEVSEFRYWNLTCNIVREAVASGAEATGLAPEVFQLLAAARVGEQIRRDSKVGQEARQAVYPVLRAARDLAEQMRLALADPRDEAVLASLARRFDLSWPEWAERIVPNLVQGLLARGADIASIKATGIDFADMLWLPAVLHLRPYTTYPYVIVDEAHDLSPAMLALVLSLVDSRRGRFVALGDPEQAINAFAGADCRSFAKIIERTQATVLPLPICYRCDGAIVDVARFWAPDIQARPGAPAGVVDVMDEADFRVLVEPGDLVLARTNRTLVTALFDLIAAGKPAKIRGRLGLTDELVDTAEQFQRLDLNVWADPVPAAGRYQREQAEMLLRTNHGDDADPRLEELADRVDAAARLITLTKASGLDAFRTAISKLFAPESDETAAHLVTLCSSHRAKGLGCTRVFVLKPEEYPSRAARTPEDHAQETNLMYVTVTRAKHELYFVGEDCGGFTEAVQGAARSAVPEPAPEPVPEPATRSDTFWPALLASGRAAEVETLWRRGEIARAVATARSLVPAADATALVTVFGPVWRGVARVVPP